MAPARPAELGRDAGLLDVEVGDVELVRVAPEIAVARVRDVDAVEEELVVLPRRRPRWRRRRLPLVSLATPGDHLDEPLVRSLPSGEVLDDLLAVVEVDLGGLLVDLGHGAGHDDLRLRRLDQDERELGVIVDRDENLLARRPEALQIGRDNIVSRQKDRELEPAPRARDGVARRLRAGDRHRGAGNRGPGAVFDDAGDRPGLGREGGRGGHDERHRDQNPENVFHQASSSILREIFRMLRYLQRCSGIRISVGRSRILKVRPDGRAIFERLTSQTPMKDNNAKDKSQAPCQSKKMFIYRERMPARPGDPGRLHEIDPFLLLSRPRSPGRCPARNGPDASPRGGRPARAPSPSPPGLSPSASRSPRRVQLPSPRRHLRPRPPRQSGPAAPGVLRVISHPRDAGLRLDVSGRGGARPRRRASPSRRSVVGGLCLRRPDVRSRGVAPPGLCATPMGARRGACLRPDLRRRALLHEFLLGSAARDGRGGRDGRGARPARSSARGAAEIPLSTDFSSARERAFFYIRARGKGSAQRSLRRSSSPSGSSGRDGRRSAAGSGASRFPRSQPSGWRGRPSSRTTRG